MESMHATKLDRKLAIDGKPFTKPRLTKGKLNQVIVEEVLLWVASGGTLRSYCRQEGKPAYTTIYNWMNRKDNEQSKDFLERFQRSREMGADYIADEILEMVDEPPRLIGEDDPRIDPSWVNLTRLRCDLRLRLLSKWHPQKWSDKTNLEHSGGISLTVSTGVPQQ